MRDSQLKSKPGRHQPHRRECTAEGPSTVLYGYVNLTSLHGHMQPGHGRGRILGIDNSGENLWSSTWIFSLTYCEIFSCVQEIYKLLLLPRDCSTLLSLADFWRPKANIQATNSWQEVSRNTSCLSSRPSDRGRYSSKIFNRTDDIQIRFYLEEKGRLSEKSYFVRK